MWFVWFLTRVFRQKWNIQVKKINPRVSAALSQKLPGNSQNPSLGSTNFFSGLKSRGGWQQNQNMSADAEHAVLQDDVPNQQLLLEPSRLSDVSSASLRTTGIRCIGAILQSGMRPSRAKSNNCPTLRADSDPKYLCEPGARFQFIIQSVSLELEVGAIPVWSLFTVTTIKLPR